MAKTRQDAVAEDRKQQRRNREEPLTCALELAGLGWRVFPIRRGDKIPLTEHGFKDASTDEHQIKRWWKNYRNANVGVATGGVSGIIVLDVDAGHGGYKALEALEDKYDHLPDTVESNTGGGGSHIFFRHPGHKVPNSAGGLGEGLDIRGDGGYVVLPPSLHSSGKNYSWARGVSPYQIEVAEAPGWLLNLLKKPRPAAARAGGQTEAISEGTRNDTLFRTACAMTKQNVSSDVIFYAVQEENQAKCSPPLEDSEVETIVQNALNYPAPSDLFITMHTSDGTKLPDHYTLTDEGNALRFVKRHGDRVRFCKPQKAWYVWNGICWSRDMTDNVAAFMKLVLLDIYNEVKVAEDDARAPLAAHVKSSLRKERIFAAVRLAESERAITILPDQIDKDSWLFNCNNGTLNLKTGKLQEHEQTDLITKVAPVDFDPEAVCPLWMKFLDEIMDGNKGLIGYLQRLCGVWLTGDVSEQTLPILYGSGANGKNTFLETVLGIMGEYAGAAPPYLVVLRQNQEHPTELADLFGKRLVVASEPEGRQMKLRVQLVKRLTGDRYIKGRFMRGDYFQFERTNKIALVTNSRPGIYEDSHAIWRRLKLVPFNVEIPEQKQDRHLLNKLMAEWPGILAWAVRGCLDWQENGIQEPGDVQHATSEYRRDENILAEFIESECAIGDGFKASSASLWEAYHDWCDEKKLKDWQKVGNKTAFGKALKSFGLKKKSERVGDKTQQVVYYGLALGAVGTSENVEANRAIRQKVVERRKRGAER